MIMLNKTRYKKKIVARIRYKTVGPDQGIYPEYSQGEHWPQLELRHTLTYFIKKNTLMGSIHLSICLDIYLFISHVLDNMHAFMALFFYELVRDQIVFIWHAWATAAVHRWSLFLSAGPCLQHFFDDGENAPIDQVMSKTDFNHLFIYLFIMSMYLFICAVWFKIWALLLLLTHLLKSAALYHCATCYNL